MYGRGCSDDGYAPFAGLLAIKIAQMHKRISRVVLVIECEEESGSKSLLALLDAAKDLIKAPDTCLCLDSGALNYE